MRNTIALLLSIAAASAALAEPQQRTSRGYLDTVENVISKIAKRPDLVSLIKAHNKKYATISPEQILELDKRWLSGDPTVIKPVLANPLSKFLVEQTKASRGRFAELIVMGKRGLAIGVNPKTTDLWQGDEAKWLETFAKGASGFHSGRVKLDKSTNKFESQISRTVVINGEILGAITVGIDVAFGGDR